MARSADSLSHASPGSIIISGRPLSCHGFSFRLREYFGLRIYRSYCSMHRSTSVTYNVGSGDVLPGIDHR